MALTSRAADDRGLSYPSESVSKDLHDRVSAGHDTLARLKSIHL